MKNKKGSLPLELFAIIIVLFGFGIIAFMSKDILDDLNTDIQADPDLSNQTKSTTQSLTTRLPSVFDGAFILIFILLWIAVLVLGYQIDIMPVYFVLAIILLIIAVGVAMAINNAYTEFIGDSEFTLMPTYFPMTNFILDNLAVVIAVIGTSLMIVLYGKMRAY